MQHAMQASGLLLDEDEEEEPLEDGAKSRLVSRESRREPIREPG